MALAQALRGDALRYIDELIGANGEVALTSFYALRLSFPPRRNAHFGIERYLESIGSGKSRVAGASGISELRTAARELCAARGLEHSVAESSVVALMFVCGHGIHDDPLYPWVSATLARPGTTEERIDRLERKALHYLDATIAYWEQSVTPKQGG